MEFLILAVSLIANICLIQRVRYWKKMYKMMKKSRDMLSKYHDKYVRVKMKLEQIVGGKSGTH